LNIGPVSSSEIGAHQGASKVPTRKHLLVLLDGLGASTKGVARLAILVGLELDGELGQVSNHVLDLGVGLGAGLAAKVVKGRDDGQEVVDHSDDDSDTNGVGPDDNDGDDVDVAVVGELAGVLGVALLEVTTGQPAPDTEAGSQDIDNEDGNNQLPRGPGLSTTGHEDEPVLSQSNLKEEDRLGRTPVLDDTAVAQEHSTTDDPGGGSEQNTENNGDHPDLGQLPLDGASLEVSVVVSDGNGGKIGEQSDEDNQIGTNGLVNDDHGGNKVDLKVKTQRNTVLNVGLHALENLAGKLDSIDDGGETGGEEDNIGGSLGSLGGTLDSDTTVSLLQGRSVVDTVTSHSGQVTTLLEHLDDLVLVLGEDLSETVSLLNEVVLGGTSETTVDQTLRVVNLGTKGKHLAGLLGDGDGVTSKHLDGQTENLSLSDGVGSVVTRGVEHGVHAQKLPGLTLLLDGDTEGTETTASELSSLVTVELGLLLGALRHVEDGLGGTLGTDVADTIAGTDGGDALGDGVEGSVLLGDPVARENLTGLGVAAQSKDGDLVDGVEVLDVVGRGDSGNGHHPVDINTLGDVGLTDGQLVGSESTGLVRAENVDTSEGLNGGELLDDSLLLGEVGSTDSEGGGGDNGQTDGDTDNEQNQGVVEQVVVGGLGGSNLQVTEETTNPGCEDPEHDENEKGGTDVVHDSLEVTLVLGALDESSGATNERLAGGSSDNSVGLAALATGGVVASVGHVLVDSERFTSDGGLVTSNERNTLVGLAVVILVVIVGLLLEGVIVDIGEVLLVGLVHLGLLVVTDQADISRDNSTLLNDDNVTSNELTSKDLLLLAVADNNSTHSNITLERSHDISGLLLLVPTDQGVKSQDTTDDTEINPVTKTSSEQNSELHN